MRKLTVGVIGAGNISGLHIPNILRSGRMTMRWLADINREKLNERRSASIPADLRSSVRLTTRPDEVLSDPEVDAVIICTPLETHKELVLRAGRAGKHVFVEKPLAPSIADCREIMDAAGAAGIECQVGYWFRFSPLFIQIRKDIPNPFMILARCAVGGGEDFDPAVHLNDDPLAADGLLDLAGYCFDISCFLAGSEPVSVFAQTPSAMPSSTSSSLVKFSDGALANIICSKAGRGGALPKWFFEVYGGKAGASIDNLTTLKYRGLPGEDVEDNPYHNGFNEELDIFAGSLLNHTPVPMDAWQGSVATVLVEKAIRSMRTGLPESVDLARELGPRP